MDAADPDAGCGQGGGEEGARWGRGWGGGWRDGRRVEAAGTEAEGGGWRPEGDGGWRRGGWRRVVARHVSVCVRLCFATGVSGRVKWTALCRELDRHGSRQMIFF